MDGRETDNNSGKPCQACRPGKCCSVGRSALPLIAAIASVSFLPLVISTASFGQVSNQLITISSNGLYLVNSYTNQPVFIIGDDGFGTITDLDSDDVTTYLQDRASRGYNAIWMGAVDNIYQPNPPTNYYGYSPFDGADFTNEDPNYWAHLDSVIAQASSLGITVFLSPFFVGDGPQGGYYTSVLNSPDAVMTAYGTFLGNRYKGYDNIVWVLGGDSIPSVSGLYAKLSDVGTAIAAADPNHLITLEACRSCVTNGYNSIQAFLAVPMSVPPWLGLDWAYPQYSTTVAACQNAYNQSPFLPPLGGENFYELENGMTELGLRFEMYSEVLSGCYGGRIFGNGAIWSFDSPNGSTCCRGGSPTWQSQLDSAGSVAEQYQGKLFSSREHWKLVPDLDHSVVTAGYGSGLSMTTDARTSDGQTIIAYIPNGNATTITVAMDQITSSSSTATASWYNPQTGATTPIGTYSNSGSQNFTAPDGNDWALVIDDGSTPTVIGTFPSSGPTSGGTGVTITGTNFAFGATVTFGGIAATKVVVISATQITATTPAGNAGAVTVAVTNNNGQSGSLTNGFTYNTAAPVITSPGTASGTVGTAFSYQITATNSPTSYGATGLPAGLSVNSGTGLISGTPTTAGVSPVTLSATNAAGTGNATLTLTVTGVPVITSPTTASGTVGTAFSYQITATNSPTSYGATGLPAGLSVNSGTGLISGTPTTAGVSPVTLSATNGGGTGTAPLTLTINSISSSPPSFVQIVANASPGTANSFSLSFPKNTVAGDLIVVAFDYDTNSTPSSVTDSQSNVFTPVGSQLTSPGQVRSRVYYAKSIKGGADAVTVKLSANSGWIELYLAEYTGLDQSNPIDAQAGATGNAGSVSSGNATTTVAGDLIFGYCVADWACTAGSGFAARSTFNHNLIEDMLVGNPGPYAATGSANNGWTMQMVALKP